MNLERWILETRMELAEEWNDDKDNICVSESDAIAATVATRIDTALISRLLERVARKTIDTNIGVASLVVIALIDLYLTHF